MNVKMLKELLTVKQELYHAMDKVDTLISELILDKDDTDNKVSTDESGNKIKESGCKS